MDRDRGEGGHDKRDVTLKKINYYKLNTLNKLNKILQYKYIKSVLFFEDF